MDAWVFGEHGTWAGIVVGLAFLICGLAAAWVSRSHTRSVRSLESKIRRDVLHQRPVASQTKGKPLHSGRR